MNETVAKQSGSEPDRLVDLEERITKLESAAGAVIQARERYIDAMNGWGHPDEPHDEMLRFGSDPPMGLSDCSRCGGAQYGTEADFDMFLGELRMLLQPPPPTRSLLQSEERP